MNQQKWREKAYNEWVGRTTGSRLNMDQARGADARRAADAARVRSQAGPTTPSFSPPVGGGASVHRNHPPAAPRSARSPKWAQQRTSTSSAPGASRVLCVVGALVGYGYGVATTVEAPWLLALAGAIAGAFVLDVMAFVFKVVKLVVLTILTLAGLAVALYVLAMLVAK
jgi:hypothetical protein